jgi:hypothetical protein
MRRLFPIIMALLLAGAASGATWVVGGVTSTVESKSDQSFTYTFTGSDAGDQTNRQDVSECDSPSISLSGSDTSVSFYDCDTATVDRSDCIPAITLPDSAGAFGPTATSFSRGFVHLWVTNDGAAGGTATVTCNDVPDKKFVSGTGWSTPGAQARSEFISAWAVNADTVNCVVPAAVTLNSGPVVGGVVCADNDASTIDFNLQLPKNFTGSTVTVGVQAVADTSTGDYAGDLDADVSAFCENASGLTGPDWGSEIPLDITFTTQWDIEMATSAPVTPTATCQGGDSPSHLFVRYQVDAAGTDNDIGSQILGFVIGYDVVGFDE